MINKYLPVSSSQPAYWLATAVKDNYQEAQMIANYAENQAKRDPLDVRIRAKMKELGTAEYAEGTDEWAIAYNNAWVELDE